MNEETLSFEDGLLLCKYIFQCAIQKTLQGVQEQWDIFYKTHELLEQIQKEQKKERLFEVLYELDMQDVYQQL